MDSQEDSTRIRVELRQAVVDHLPQLIDTINVLSLVDFWAQEASPKRGMANSIAQAVISQQVNDAIDTIKLAVVMAGGVDQEEFNRMAAERIESFLDRFERIGEQDVPDDRREE